MSEVKCSWQIYEDHDPFVKNRPNISHTVVLYVSNGKDSKLFQIPISFNLGMEIIDAVNEMD